MRIAKKIISVSLATTLSAGSAFAAWSLDHTLFQEVAQKFDLDPYLLYSVALTESAFSTQAQVVAPHPWTLRTSKTAYYLKDEEDTIRQLKQLESDGVTSIDVGLMQVNLRWHRKRVKDSADLVKPAKNLEVGSLILLEALKKYPNDEYKALGYYHSPSDAERGLNYASRVMNTYKKVKAHAGY